MYADGRDQLVPRGVRGVPPSQQFLGALVECDAYIVFTELDRSVLRAQHRTASRWRAHPSLLR